MTSLRCVNPPTTASLFVQLSMRRQTVTSALPILDLFLPLRASCRTHHSTAIAAAQAAARSRATVVAPFIESPRKAFQLPAARFPLRSFSTTRMQRATHAIFNPQHDDDGNEMTLEITQRAAKRLSEIMTKDANPRLALRIQVESGGCHGFQYLMKLVTLPDSLPEGADMAGDDSGAGIRSDDTIFTYSPEGSAVVDLEAPKIILDAPSLELLKGSKVDFTMELIGSQFKIVDNPLATSSCGCGTSFDIKV